ncbi:putative AlkP superfamily pyrophosphatase or phosphodiesterase [Algoriphagus sp. 4150]|uniref:alkaline phosphatase family protein n=1 Tax=Algoriphagus sp. 4150 TaxID=2817756 RepID=UPI00285F037C|nr:alkaline phosphatase family protein [Algoriphagus sp. 4150]MDR7129248.1 putative AlkP superfamily pyrophosphatase or phosphodiesterase [Algoriphagus sp. 4150]
MKKILLLIIWFSLAISESFAQEAPKKVVFIILDGIAYDVIKEVNTPNIDRIASAGGFSRAYVGGEKGGYSETPTISAVGYNSLLTGTWVNKHNVFGNNIRRPNYNYWTIFRYLREARPNAKLAVFSTWLDNRTKLIGEALEATGNITIDYAFDGFELDTMAFPHDEKKDYISKIDEHVSQETARYIMSEGPDLSWVYLEYPDDMGHQYGDSPQLVNAVQNADRQAGLIYDAVLSRIEMGEDWLIVVTTDHGRQPTTGLHHGGQSDRERDIWLATNAQNLNSYFHEETVAITDILPTMIRHLEIPVPEQNLNEIDGVPLTGSISVFNPDVRREDGKILFSWKFIGGEDEKIEIWFSKNNKFRTTGNADEYKLLATVDGTQKHWSVSASGFDSPQMKIVFKGKHNTVNKWLVKPKKDKWE